MKIAIGSDHRGFELKQYVQEKSNQFNQKISWFDVGCFSLERCDYPEPSRLVALEVQAKMVDAGILLCGSGVGVSIAANRFRGVYAALVWDEETARLAKEHDLANVLVLPADFISKEQALAMVKAWLDATFLEGRYRKRIDMVDTFGGIKK